MKRRLPRKAMGCRYWQRSLGQRNGDTAGAGRASAAPHGPDPADTPPSNTGVNNGRGGRGVSVEERLILDGQNVRLLCAERQQQGYAGVMVDYLRFTVRRDAAASWTAGEGASDSELTQAIAFRVAGLLGFELGEERPGRDYYLHTWTIFNAFGKEVASVSGGGETQRGTFCVTVKGEACTFASNGWERRLHDELEPLDPRVTRIDAARDFFAGEITIEEVEASYFAGAFDYRNRRPSFTRHGSGDGEAEGLEHSRTFQVGRRDSGKLMRAYEKGHQFGLMADPWVRLEVELRNSNGRVIPWAAVVRPADFFAGAYQFCEMVLHDKPIPERVVTGRKVGEASVERLMEAFERSYGATVAVIGKACGDDFWLAKLAIKHANRPMPKRIAGLRHDAVTAGVAKWLNELDSGVAPAGSALH